MPQVSLKGSIKISLGILAFAATTFAQTDPGVRGGAAGAGGAIPGLTVKEGKFFNSGQDAFAEVASVLGTIPDTEEGLGIVRWGTPDSTIELSAGEIDALTYADPVAPSAR
jgi:hypothetical protein